MMHGREKSDSAIVAEKPTNKVVSATAEPVEPRAGAKGNASQQSTLRTQCRKCVSQALERIRQVRRHSPKVGAVCSRLAHHPVLANHAFPMRRQIGRFCGDFRPLISRIWVSASVGVVWWRFLAPCLCIQKFRSRRLGFERAYSGFCAAAIRNL